MCKEIHILKVIESMQATVDSLSEELLTAIDREKNIPQETALSSYVFNASLIGVDFVYINVSISALAALKTDNVYAKRYHWKNVVAGILKVLSTFIPLKSVRRKL